MKARNEGAIAAITCLGNALEAGATMGFRTYDEAVQAFLAGAEGIQQAIDEEEGPDVSISRREYQNRRDAFRTVRIALAEHRQRCEEEAEPPGYVDAVDEAVKILGELNEKEVKSYEDSNRRAEA